MRNHHKLPLLMLALALALSTSVGTATALRAIETPRVNLRSRGRITVRSPGIRPIICTVRLTGTEGGTIQKRAGAAIGSITEAIIERCEGGFAQIDERTLPWPKKYRGFNGSLPNILGFRTSIPLKITVESSEIPGIRCRYSAVEAEGTANSSRGEANVIDQFVFDESLSLPSETLFCPSGSVSGTLSTEPVMRVRLV